MEPVLGILYATCKIKKDSRKAVDVTVSKLDPIVLELLKRASTATIQSQLFKLGLRNTFLFGLRPLNPDRACFVGEAFTLRYVPAREDLDVLDVFNDPYHPQRYAIEQVQPGQVLVSDCRGDARAASGGEILITRLAKRGAAAVITDGSVRDSRGVSQCGIPVYTAGISATINLTLHHAVDFQIPIGCAGVSVYPGDILVGDHDGIVVIPRQLAEKVAEPAVEQERLERFIKTKIEAGAALPGTYPPNDATMSEYEEHSARASVRDSAS